MNFFIKFFICGVLTSFLFPPFFLTPLGFIILPYLFNLLSQKNYLYLSYKKHFFSGFLFGLGFFLIFLGWIKEPFLINDNWEMQDEKFLDDDHLMIFNKREKCSQEL